MIYAIVIIGAIALDRLVKSFVMNSFSAGDTVSVIGDFFHITYVQNTGVAFSLMEDHPGAVLAVTACLLAAALIFLVLTRKDYPLTFTIGLALVFGGGLGNLIDRKMYGYVVDMFDFGSFPVFNVADICVCVGCGLMLLYAIRSLRNG